MDPTTRDRVLIAYSHQDAAWVERLENHLKALKLDVWDDQRFRAEGDLHLRDALAQAKVAVLLVSQNFLTSDFVAKDRLRLLLDAENGLTVALVPIRPGDFAAIMAPGDVVMLNLWKGMFHGDGGGHWSRGKNSLLGSPRITRRSLGLSNTTYEERGPRRNRISRCAFAKAPRTALPDQPQAQGQC